MTRAILISVLLALTGVWAAAQETKPVPKDSIRISIPGCAKGAVFTVGRRTADEPGTADVAEGLRLHMNGSKKLMASIKPHEAGMIEITGIVKRDDLAPSQAKLGKGIGISPGPTTPSVQLDQRGTVAYLPDFAKRKSPPWPGSLGSLRT